MSLKLKLLSIPGICVIGFIIFGLITWNTLNVVKVNGEYYEKIVLDKDLIADILPPPEYIIESRLLLYEIMEEKDDGKLKDLFQKVKTLSGEFEERHGFWFKNLPEGKLKDQMVVKSYQPAKEFFQIVNHDFFPAILQGDREKAQNLIRGTLSVKYQEHRLAIDEVVKLANERFKRTEAEASTTIRQRGIFLIALAIAIIALSLSLTWYFVEFRIVRKMVGIIAGLQSTAQQVAMVSADVSSTSQQLAQGASEQAAGLEETSSSIEEMTSMTRQNADNANQANTLMAETSRVVDEANHSMSDLTESMKEISTASEETAKIVKTIDEIAFQTNLLALNAAVEAARAGEAGAGFAVVADEVRNLAMRAATAARNTANLIEDTVKKIKNGSNTVARTNEAFVKVASGARKVGELVGDISAATSEQDQGVNQINKAVAEMDKVVQKNAASAEESASTAEEMTTQAESLKGFVGELVVIMGGNGIGHGPKPGTDPRLVGAHRSNRAIEHHPERKIKQTRKAALRNAKEVNPSQVIPMEEGDYLDF